MKQVKIIQRVASRLQADLKLDDDQFLRFMTLVQQYGGEFSGSCLLQYLHNAQWEKNDIDLFIPYSSILKFTNSFKQLNISTNRNRTDTAGSAHRRRRATPVRRASGSPKAMTDVQGESLSQTASLREPRGWHEAGRTRCRRPGVDARASYHARRVWFRDRYHHSTTQRSR